MRRVMVISLMLAGMLVSCGGGDKEALKAAQKQADILAIEHIESTWHKASSLKDLNLMMSIWADDATATLGSQTYVGRDQIRDFFATKAASFKPENHWLSDHPAYKMRVTVDGDRGTLYFECHYIDVQTRQVKAVVAADQKVARIKGRWLITSLVSATPALSI